MIEMDNFIMWVPIYLILELYNIAITLLLAIDNQIFPELITLKDISKI